MKARLFTPGPTPVPDDTLLELARPVTYHRSAEAKAILAEVTDDLKYVFQTANPVLTLTSSGTGGIRPDQRPDWSCCSRRPRAAMRFSIDGCVENSSPKPFLTPGGKM